MPKEILVDPARLSENGELSFATVRLYAYDTPFQSALSVHGAPALKTALRHMMLIREFETMLGQFKSTGAYREIPYVYRGPAHLSMGQEGTAVGAAMALSVEDHIFGSHRSHGELLAKGLAAIDKMGRTELAAVMEAHDGGALLRTVETHLGGTDTTLAENFPHLRRAGRDLHARQRL